MSGKCTGGVEREGCNADDGPDPFCVAGPELENIIYEAEMLRFVFIYNLALFGQMEYKRK